MALCVYGLFKRWRILPEAGRGECSALSFAALFSSVFVELGSPIAKTRKSCGLADVFAQTHGDVGVPPKTLPAVVEEEEMRR